MPSTLPVQQNAVGFRSSADGIQNLLAWSKPRRESGKKGSEVVRTAQPDAHFMKFYKANRLGLLAAGVHYVQKKNGDKVIEWRRNLLEENQDRKNWEKSVVQFTKKHLGFKVNMTGLFDFQGIAVKRNVWSLRKYGFSLEASDTGYGKTYVLLATARQVKMRVLAIVPKTIITVWKRVAKHHFNMEDRLIGCVNVEKLKTGNTEFGHWEDIIVNGEEDKKWVWTIPDDVIVVLDELHRFKGINSQNGKIFQACKDQEIPTIGASATVANDPTHMRGLGKILGLHDGSFEDFYRWARQNGCADNGWGNLTFFGGLHVLNDLHATIFPEHGNRQRVADIPDFPDTIISAETYDMGANAKHIREAYEKMERELQLLEEKEKAAKAKRNRLVILLRARQKIELLKVPAMVEMAKDALEEGNHVAFFVNFNETARQLGKALKSDCFIWGANSKGERDAFIDAFQADKEPVIICNIRAGGVGISLHDLNGKYPRVSIIAPSYSAQDLIQALGRVHRAGGKSKSVQKVVFAAATVEESVCNNVNAKLQCLHTLQDGDMNAGVNLFD